jgi:hypothetical protein
VSIAPFFALMPGMQYNSEEGQQILTTRTREEEEKVNRSPNAINKQLRRN